MEYTKGELGGWRNQGGVIMTDSHNNRKVVARVENNKAFTVDEVIANARLLSASPDLYEACKFVANQIIAWTDFKPELIPYTKLAIKTLDGAIAKAK